MAFLAGESVLQRWNLLALWFRKACSSSNSSSKSNQEPRLSRCFCTSTATLVRLVVGSEGVSTDADAVNAPDSRTVPAVSFLSMVDSTIDRSWLMVSPSSSSSSSLSPQSMVSQSSSLILGNNCLLSIRLEYDRVGYLLLLA